MKRLSPECFSAALLLVALLLVLSTDMQAASSETVLYQTGFEATEGYNLSWPLAGQNAWVSFGSGGNGLVKNFFAGLGQQAFVGFSAPAETNDFVSVYHPVNPDLLPTNQAIIKFSVLMQVVDSSSTNGPWDDFRWSVYNLNGNRLFSLDFDNASLEISYLLDNTNGFISTGSRFDNLGSYDLEIAMNFGRNLWSATLNEVVVVNSQPITTVGSPLTLGDVDAVWVLRDPKAPGDNYLLFDNYRITTDGTFSIPARVEAVGFGQDGSYQARLYGEPGLSYQIEASNDLRTWGPLLTVVAPAGGVFEFHDAATNHLASRFYRALQAR
jgi:hypothetical protein